MKPMPNQLNKTMRKRILLIALFLNISIIYPQTKTIEDDNNVAFYSTVKNWFSAWELISKDVYKMNKVKPVEFVFFDNTYVYSTSNVTISDESAINGPVLLNLNLKWKKRVHNGSIIMPDKTKMDVGIMAFASTIPNENGKSFFVMPLASFWKEAGVDSNELGLHNLLTGIFIHEFSHSQQMQNYGKQLSLLENSTNFSMPFDDNLIQNIFQKDNNYVKAYNQELAILNYIIKQEDLNKSLFNRLLALMKQRRNEYFKENYKELVTIEDFFLTTEGLGQYSMYLWLIHPKGGNFSKQVAIDGVRRNKKWWSQEQGFSMFLVLEKITKSKKWGKELFGVETSTVTSIIEKNYKKQNTVDSF
jgi:hypothetical protein